MNIELKQQLSSLLDEWQDDNNLDNFLQALHQEKNLRDLYNRYTLIGAVIRGEAVNINSLQLSEQIRNNLWRIKSVTSISDFSLIRWFNYTNVWTLITTTAILIIIIGLPTWVFNKIQTSSTILLSHNRQFLPGIITLDKNQNLSNKIAITPAYPNNYLEIALQQQQDDMLNFWRNKKINSHYRKIMQYNKANNYSNIPIPYNNFVNYYK